MVRLVIFPNVLIKYELSAPYPLASIDSMYMGR